MAVAIRREDRRHTLAVEAPGRLSGNTRRLTGLARRDLDADFLRPERPGVPLTASRSRILLEVRYQPSQPVDWPDRVE